MDQTIMLPEHPPAGLCKCGQIEIAKGISIWMDLEKVLHRRDRCG